MDVRSKSQEPEEKTNRLIFRMFGPARSRDQRQSRFCNTCHWGYLLYWGRQRLFLSAFLSVDLTSAC